MITTKDGRPVNPDDDLVSLMQGVCEWLSYFDAERLRMGVEIQRGGQKVTYHFQIKEVTRQDSVIEGYTA